MTEGWCSKGRDVGGLNAMREGGEKQEESGLLPSLIYVDMQLELKLSDEAHASALTRSSTNLRSSCNKVPHPPGPIPQAFALASLCSGVGRASHAPRILIAASVPLVTTVSSSSWISHTIPVVSKDCACIPLERQSNVRQNGANWLPCQNYPTITDQQPF
jgi:hypothetical protein